MFKPLEGDVLRVVNKVSNISAPYRGKTTGDASRSVAAPVPDAPVPKKKKKKVRMHRDTVKKDQLERGIESTWSKKEIERTVVEKNIVVV